jgi:MerR family Zn(II)-responsive transcriptional regulator of zntA
VPELVTIQKAAELSGLTPKTVRFYEESGLVTPTARSESGYRLFSTTDIRRLRLVRRAKLLGLPLADVKEFADLAFQETCGAFEERLQELVDQRLLDIERTISDLEHLRAELGNLRMGLVEGRTENAACAVEDCDDCRLIDD